MRTILFRIHDRAKTCFLIMFFCYKLYSNIIRIGTMLVMLVANSVIFLIDYKNCIVFFAGLQLNSIIDG